jgi:hypothetical protein
MIYSGSPVGNERERVEVIELVPLDEVLACSGDYLDDEERAALRLV